MRFVFTGTRAGMTAEQLVAAEQLLATRAWTQHANGLCFGADAQMFRLVMNLRPDIQRIGYPCTLAEQQVKELYEACHTLMPPLPPLERNAEMVFWAAEQRSDGLLVAAPKERVEHFRGSGTWATIRYARKTSLSTIYLWPDGEVEEP